MIYARSGNAGSTVKKWQVALNQIKAKLQIDKLVEDGIFGAKTLNATIQAQRLIGTTPDGIVGDLTVKAWNKKFPNIPLGFGGSSTTTTTTTAKTTTAKTIPTSKPVVKKPKVKTASAGTYIQPESKSMLPVILIGGAVGLFFAMQKKK